MTLDTMSLVEFERALKRGLGRVIPYLQTHESTPYQEIILKYCLYNSTYDRQIENRRSTYYMEIIQLTGQKEFYRAQLLAHFAKLDESFDHYDIQQAFDMVSELAFEDDVEAIEVIHAKYRQMPALGRYRAASVIVELDGLDGLVYIAETLPKQAYDYIDWETGRLVFLCLEDDYSYAELFAHLEAAAQANPQIKVYLDAVQAELAEDDLPRKRNPESNPDFAELQQVIAKITRQDQLPRASFDLKRWGAKATSDELVLAAQALLAQTDPIHLQSYLIVFHKAAFPLEVTPLIAFAEGDEADVAREAILALANLAQPEVRQLALRLITHQKYLSYAIDLLKRTMQDEDWAMLEALLELPLENRVIHNIGLAVSHILEVNPSPLAIPLLLKFYEYTPCTGCRYRFIKLLNQLNALPDSIRQECLHDCCCDIQNLARNNFVGLTSE